MISLEAGTVCLKLSELKSSQIIYISQLTQTVTFGFTKLAVILFYRR